MAGCCTGKEIDLKELKSETQKKIGNILGRLLETGMSRGATPFGGQLSQLPDPGQMAAMNTMMGIGGYGEYQPNQYPLGMGPNMGPGAGIRPVGPPVTAEPGPPGPPGPPAGPPRVFGPGPAAPDPIPIQPSPGPRVEAAPLFPPRTAVLVSPDPTAHAVIPDQAKPGPRIATKPKYPPRADAPTPDILAVGPRTKGPGATANNNIFPVVSPPVVTGPIGPTGSGEIAPGAQVRPGSMSRPSAQIPLEFLAMLFDPYRSR